MGPDYVTRSEDCKAKSALEHTFLRRFIAPWMHLRQPARALAEPAFSHQDQTRRNHLQSALRGLFATGCQAIKRTTQFVRHRLLATGDGVDDDVHDAGRSQLFALRIREAIGEVNGGGAQRDE
jgi:hypothetical protein